MAEAVGTATFEFPFLQDHTPVVQASQAVGESPLFKHEGFLQDLVPLDSQGGLMTDCDSQVNVNLVKGAGSQIGFVSIDECNSIVVAMDGEAQSGSNIEKKAAFTKPSGTTRIWINNNRTLFDCLTGKGF